MTNLDNTNLKEDSFIKKFNKKFSEKGCRLERNNNDDKYAIDFKVHKDDKLIGYAEYKIIEKEFGNYYFNIYNGCHTGKNLLFNEYNEIVNTGKKCFYICHNPHTNKFILLKTDELKKILNKMKKFNQIPIWDNGTPFGKRANPEKYPNIDGYYFLDKNEIRREFSLI